MVDIPPLIGVAAATIAAVASAFISYRIFRTQIDPHIIVYLEVSLTSEKTERGSSHE